MWEAGTTVRGAESQPKVQVQTNKSLPRGAATEERGANKEDQIKSFPLGLDRWME